MTIPYETFPASFEACWLPDCPLQAMCLHHLCYEAKPKELTRGRAIMPEALATANLNSGRCPHYREAATVTAYAGFDHLFDELKVKDLKAVRNEVYAIMGGHRNFNRYDNAEGRYILTEAMAEQVNAVFLDHGYAAPHYERTFQTMVFK